ncbi:MAG: 5-epimerase, partial [Actinomycetota bacterium]|nr:5-epimerase [Actinomycetota bacterium]
GQAKYVYCPRGAVLDLVVDLRVGSPTFGRHAAVRLDDVTRTGVFVSEGLGHAFCALTDDADVTYLLSTTYDPGAEHGVNPLDPDLALPWPDDVGELLLSDKDRGAPGLIEARDAGALPSYDATGRGG